MTQPDWGSLGDVATLDRLEGAAREAGTDPADSYAELERRQEQGGGSWPFDAVIAENAAIFTGIGFKAVAAKRGQHWAISDDDAKRVGVSLAQVIHRYMPDFDEVGPVGNLCIVGAGLVGPRLMLDSFQKAQAKAAKAENSEGGDIEQD